MTPTQTGDKPMDRPHVQRWIAIAERANLETDDETEDSAFIGVRDGFEEAVQLIDTLTGGDGEYRFSTDPARNCPTPVEMIDCILARFEQETREQPLDTIQRLGQEFDAPEASPSLGMGEALRLARKTIQIERDHLVSCCTLNGDRNTLEEGAKPDVERMERALAAIDAALSPSPDVGLAEENGRLQEALADSIARDVEEIIEREFKGFWAKEDLIEEIPGIVREAILASATLQSISTANGGPGRDGVS